MEPDRDKNEVAPNSPSDIAIERPVARSSAGLSIGRSTCSHVASGDAPKVADALRSDTGMARAAGSTARMTKGSAMTAWMTGINQRSDLHAYGDVLKVMMMPIPRVAADTASGSENSARGVGELATNRASGTQIQAAAMANTSEVAITDRGETDNDGNVPEKTVRHAESERLPLIWTDLYRVPTSGDATIVIAIATKINGVMRCLGFVWSGCGALT